MANEIQLHESKLPTIQDLYDNPGAMLKREQVEMILNQQPPDKWVKMHPFIKDKDGSPYKYLPIDKVEFLLRKLFKKNKIEILREGTAFNGVFVTVRVWYKDIVTGDMDFHDGIGAIQLQVKSGSSPADLANINNGALSMAFGTAKTIAVKDACDHLGIIFGANLNRKDTIGFTFDTKLEEVVRTKEEERLAKLIEKAKDRETLEGLKAHLTEHLQSQFDTKWNSLK